MPSAEDLHPRMIWRAAAVVIVVVIVLLIARGGSTPPARASVIHVSVTGSRTGRPISPDFLGLALEYRAIPAINGPSAASTNPVLVQLIRNLGPQGRPVLRVGGQSADRSWWPIPHVPRPPGITYDLGQGWINSARALAQAVNARLILGIELEAGQPQISSVEARKLVSGIGQQYIDALELGNEPELYTGVAWYRRLHGRVLPWYSHTGAPVYSRPRTYNAQAFLKEFSRTMAVMPRVPIAGPDTGNARWLNPFATLVSAGSPVRTITFHAYGLNQCVKDPSSPQYPSVPNLLSLGASRGMAAGMQPLLSLAHRANAAFRVDEINSVSCNGRAGVSNTFASALWAMDALFTLASAGVDGVNIHTFPGADNGLFDFSRRASRWVGTVHPLYYGALMFAHAAPAGSRLLQIHAGAQRQLRAWATIGPDQRVRVLLINDSLRATTHAAVQQPLSTKNTTVERIEAPSPYATGRVTIGGQTFGAATATGSLGPAQVSAPARNGSAYEVSLPPATAALLTFSPAG